MRTANAFEVLCHVPPRLRARHHSGQVGFGRCTDMGFGCCDTGGVARAGVCVCVCFFIFFFKKIFFLTCCWRLLMIFCGDLFSSCKWPGWEFCKAAKTNDYSIDCFFFRGVSERVIPSVFFGKHHSNVLLFAIHKLHPLLEPLLRVGSSWEAVKLSRVDTKENCNMDNHPVLNALTLLPF